MFRIKGNKKEDHQYHVKLFLDMGAIDVGAAMVLAAIYFEWCIRRSILALGSSSTRCLRQELSRPLRVEDLVDLWNREVVKRYGDIPCLPAVFDQQKKKPRFGGLILTWKDINKIRKHRNEIVHGSNCSPTLKRGIEQVKLLIAASEVLICIVERHGHSIFKVIRRLSVKKD